VIRFFLGHTPQKKEGFELTGINVVLVLLVFSLVIALVIVVRFALKYLDLARRRLALIQGSISLYAEAASNWTRTGEHCLEGAWSGVKIRLERIDDPESPLPTEQTYCEWVCTMHYWGEDLQTIRHTELSGCPGQNRPWIKELYEQIFSDLAQLALS